MRSIHLSLLAASVLLIGCGGGADDIRESQANELKPASTSTGTSTKGKGAVIAPSFALRQTDSHVVGTDPVWKSSFPIYSTYFVYTATEVTGTLSGHHIQSVLVYEPNGQPYQHWYVAFATDVPAGSGEQQAEKTATGWRVWVYMPVATTLIDTANLAGTWKAEVTIDEAVAPNATSTFSLTQGEVDPCSELPPPDYCSGG